MSARHEMCLLLSLALSGGQALPIKSSSFARAEAATPAGDESSPQAFSLDQPSEHVFHLRPPKNGQMTILLNLEGAKGESDRLELTHFKTVIEVTMLDHAGHSVCRASGSPKSGVSADSWVLATSRGQSAFWHRNCAEIKLKHSELYTLTVDIRDVDPKTPKVKVTPALEPSDAFGP